MWALIGMILLILLALALLAAIVAFVSRGVGGSGTHAGFFYRPKGNNLDHLTDTEFFEPMQPPEVWYGLGPDPYDPKPLGKSKN